MKILTNAGYSESECYGLINKLDGKDQWIGYDIKSEIYANMKNVGIIDPSKVTRCALENASSIAGTVLLTEAAIIEIKDKEDNNNSGGGMY